MVSFCNLGSMIDVQNKDYFEQSPLYGGVSSLVFIFIKLFGFTKKIDVAVANIMIIFGIR